MVIPRKGLINHMKDKWSQKKLFPCYSIPLRDFLLSQGIRYELVGLHPDTKNMFWVFIKDEKLDKALEKWDI